MSKNSKTASSSSIDLRFACNADLFDDNLWDKPEAVTTERQMLVPPSLRVLYPADLSEVISVVEDLWMRIRRQAGMRMHVVRDAATGANMLLVRTDKANLGKAGQDLLEAAEDMDRYRWLQSPDECSYAKHLALCLVSEMTWLGDTLAIELMPLAQLARHAGTDSQLLVQAMLERLCFHSCPVPPVQGTSVQMCNDQLSSEVQKYVPRSTQVEEATRWQRQMREIKHSMDAWGL